MRPSETCNGPKWGLMENIWTSFRYEKTIPAAKAPSDKSMGSKGCQCSRGKYGSMPRNQRSRYKENP